MKNSRKRHKEHKVMYIKVKKTSHMRNYNRTGKIQDGLYIIDMERKNGKPYLYLTPLDTITLEPHPFVMYRIEKDELDRCPNSWVDMTDEISVLSRLK